MCPAGFGMLQGVFNHSIVHSLVSMFLFLIVPLVVCFNHSIIRIIQVVTGGTRSALPVCLCSAVFRTC